MLCCIANCCCYILNFRGRVSESGLMMMNTPPPATCCCCCCCCCSQGSHCAQIQSRHWRKAFQASSPSQACAYHPMVASTCLLLLLLLLVAASLRAASSFGTTCVNEQQQACPCGPPCQQCGAAFPPSSPMFHIRDNTCGINDPNFPFWDPLHGLYHLFYQDHLAEEQGGDGQGPVIGHVVGAAAPPPPPESSSSSSSSSCTFKVMPCRSAKTW